MVTFTTFEYDRLNRLVVMRMFSPDRMQELVRTRFAYEGAGTVLFRTTVKTLAEGKEWDINWKDQGTSPETGEQNHLSCGCSSMVELTSTIASSRSRRFLQLIVVHRIRL